MEDYSKKSERIVLLFVFLLVAGCNVQTTTSEIEKDSIVVIEKESHPQQDVDPDSKSANPTMDTTPEDKKDETEQRSDFLIVPGKSIGKINLGMNQEKVLQILGKPDATDAGAGTYVYTWRGKTKPYKSEVNVVTGYAQSDMKNRVVKLRRTTSMYFHTKEGAGSEKDLAEVKKLFPGLKFVKTYESANHKVKTDLYTNAAKNIVFECLNYGPKLCVGVQVLKEGSQIPVMEF